MRHVIYHVTELINETNVMANNAIKNCNIFMWYWLIRNIMDDATRDALSENSS